MNTITFSQLKVGQRFRLQGARFTKASATHASFDNQPEHGPNYPFDAAAPVEVPDIIIMSHFAERLAGCTIIDSIVDVENNRWGFQVCTPAGEYLDAWIDADPEGNGPGHLDVRYQDGQPYLRR